MAKLGDLHLVKAQCQNSTFVTKVKVVERCFADGFTVEFNMHDVAPSEGPPLPYFAVDGTVMPDENEVVLMLAKSGAPSLMGDASVDSAKLESAIAASLEIVKMVKAAVKSKNEQAMATNKASLIESLRPLETALAGSKFLAGDSFSVADVILMADTKQAFEKILDPTDRGSLPALSKWYEACYGANAAVQKVWRGELVLCEQTELAKKEKESKEEKKAREKARKAEKKQQEKKEEKKEAPKKDTSRTEGLVAKEDNFFQWYSDVVIKSELLSYYDVSGCYILRPWAYFMWEQIQAWFDAQIKTLGVENCMFPMFITEDCLNREKDHIEDFAPEVAWVTRSGQSELDKPLAIRPTSETCMYPYFANWIRSHRDLPLKLNQWTSVVRWEFKHPTPFIRSREFLWQEGHTAHETLDGALEEVLQILEWYRGIYEDLMAVPVIRGWKSEKEKFAGAYKTSTVEAFIPDTGKGVQGATSHCLGQNFAKMFNIRYSNEAKEELYVYQNSWGCTTRTLGVMIMTHGDSKGLVVPPRIAPKHAVIVPIVMNDMSDDEKRALWDKATELERELVAGGVRATADLRENYNPGWKYAHWEMKGVCVRIELGPKDMQRESVMTVRRDNGRKEAVAWADLVPRLRAMTAPDGEIQRDMYAAAKARFDACLETVDNMDAFAKALDAKHMVLAPWADEKAIEEAVKAATAKKPDESTGEGGEAGAKVLCIPFEQPDLPPGTACFYSGKPAKNYALWGRSY